jgi:hypothetical protein
MRIKGKDILAKIALFFSSVIIVVSVLELAMRTFGDNRHDMRVAIMRSSPVLKLAYPGVHDSRLGWVPEPGFRDKKNIWNTRVTISDDGIRSNGDNEIAGDRITILAVGDSFTFGDEVSDGETWPSFLESLSGIRVINGGVFGYGLDQSILRAEMLLGKYRPDLLVISVIPRDITRVRKSVYMGQAKPYFSIEDGRLKLNNIPVPYLTESMSGVRRTLGRSYLVNEIMWRIDPAFWTRGTRAEHILEHNSKHITLLLLERAIAMSGEREIPVVILVQYEEKPTPFDFQVRDYLLDVISKKGMHYIDMWRYQGEIAKNNPSKHHSFYNEYGRHMSPAGNEFVAGKTYRFLIEQELIPANTYGALPYRVSSSEGEGP